MRLIKWKHFTVMTSRSSCVTWTLAHVTAYDWHLIEKLWRVTSKLMKRGSIPFVTWKPSSYRNYGFSPCNVEKDLALLAAGIIDYRCADSRFMMSPRGMAVSNTRYLYDSETRVNAGIRAWKLHLSESNWYQESVGGICFTNKWRAASLQSMTFQTTAKMQYFQMHLLA